MTPPPLLEPITVCDWQGNQCPLYKPTKVLGIY